MKDLKTVLFILFLSAIACQSAVSQTLYKVTLFRAAPGKLLPLIENLKERVVSYEKKGGNRPFIVRHSQGDQWDLMVYEHINSYQLYYQTPDFNKVFTPA